MIYPGCRQIGGRGFVLPEGRVRAGIDRMQTRARQEDDQDENKADELLHIAFSFSIKKQYSSTL
jgi:hypothetical protein